MPLSTGRVESGTRIEPYATIKEFNPLVYYRLNEASGTIINYGSVASRNGTGSNLTYAQSPIPPRSPAKSIDFNGTSSYIAITDGVITGSSPQYSVGVWFETTSIVGTVNVFQQQDASNSGAGFRIYINGTAVQVEGIVSTGSGVDFVANGTITGLIDSGDPVFVGFAVGPTIVSLYINGILVDTSPRSGGTYSSTSDMFIGRNYNATNYFDGKISDAFVTSQVLDQYDFNRIYRNGRLNNPSPLGDNFLDAPTITVTDTQTDVDYTMTGGQLEDGEPPLDAGVYSNQSIWRKFIAPSPGVDVTYTFISDGFDHTVELYHSADGLLANLTLVDSYDGSPSGSLSGVELTEGDTYYVRMRSTGAEVTGDLTLSVHYAEVGAGLPITTFEHDWTLGSLPSPWVQYPGDEGYSYVADGTGVYADVDFADFKMGDGTNYLFNKFTLMTAYFVTGHDSDGFDFLDFGAYGLVDVLGDLQAAQDTRDYWRFYTGSGASYRTIVNYPGTPPTGLIVLGLTYDAATGARELYMYTDDGEVHTSSPGLTQADRTINELYVSLDNEGGTVVPVWKMRHTLCVLNDVYTPTEVYDKAVAWGWTP